MNNIVIFGKAHSGKSTILGYLISKTENYDLNKTEKQFMKDMGCNYKSSDFFRYIVDDTEYERMRTSKNPKLGSTVESHIRKITLPEVGQITVIDTPGGEHREKNRLRGMYYANIGVFCIEMRDVLSKDFYKEGNNYSLIISSLMLWTALERKKVIIALTKADLCDFSEKDYKNAKERINDLCNSISKINEVIILPVSVEINKRIGHNILEKSNKLDWCNDKTLCEALIDETKKTNSEKNEDLLFCVDRQIKKSNSFVGKVWRIKILSGSLNIDDEIMLTPVINQNKQFISISAKIKTIRLDNHSSEKDELIEQAPAGSIVGIDLKDMKLNGKQINKSEFDTIFTTCGFSKKCDFKTSKYFQFEVSSVYNDMFTKNSQLSLLWFGRPITFIVRNTMLKNNALLVNAEIQVRCLSVPLGDLENYYKSIIIREKNQLLSMPYEATFKKLLEENEINF